MLQILGTLLLAGLSQWALSVGADTDEEKKVNAHVIVLSGDDCEDAAAAVAGDPTAKSFVWVAKADDHDDGRSEGGSVKRIVKRIKSANAGDAERGWLGVTIGEVSDAVTSQLSLGDRGIMVLNVVPEGPADHAGIEAHDVIVMVGDAELSGTVRQAVELIARHKPGDELAIKALREGKEKTITVTLGSRADMSEFDWKMAVPPSAEIEEEIRTHGRILRRGDDGQWIFEDLGDLTVLENLPENVLQFIPKAGSRTIHISGDDTKKTVRCTVQQDGTALVIEQEDDGEIVVHRTDGAGNESTKTYANADELREGDPEAFEFFDDAGHDVVVDIDIEGLPDLADLPDFPEIDIELDLDDLPGHVEEWRTNLSEGLENYEQYLDQLRDFIEQWKDGRGSHNLTIPFGAAPFTGEPRHTFEVRVDGTIEARIRKGDSELVRIYQNEADLERRRPELFKKYQDLTAAEE
ncbi:MAG: S1C family serine protease [Planctomycetota bacterium]|jgi:hypothetical protein